MILFFLVIYLVLFNPFLLANSLFHPPVLEDFFIHPGEGFCDEMYYYSYSTRTYHTAEDYIKKWKKKPIQLGEDNIETLEKLHLQHYGHLPTQASFWDNLELRKNFLKINLYRDGLDIIDTNLGLYPRTETDEAYGYGENFFAVYDGRVIANVEPETPLGWGKALLIKHTAPEGFVFEITWNEQKRQLKEFWTQYSHNETHLVGLNELVKKGEILGTIGDGNGIFHSIHGKKRIKEGAHLHFEIRIKDYPIFPSKSLLQSKEKLTEIYIQPSYFLKNAILKPVKK